MPRPRVGAKSVPVNPILGESCLPGEAGGLQQPVHMFAAVIHVWVMD